MKITAISAQANNPNRVNVSVDGKYRFSLDVFQVTELGVRVGAEYSETELAGLEEESAFGKLYARSLEYMMMRPHSAKELRDYLWKKTRDSKVRNRKTGEWRERKGVSPAVTERVFERLYAKGYVNDMSFARWWVENRNVRKGASRRKLEAELRAKGVIAEVISEVMQNCPRDEKSELLKIIEKKRSKYTDDKKLTMYLVRQGFNYNDIREALIAVNDEFVE